MMQFRTVTKAIIALLGASAAGQFRVVGFKGQGKGAGQVKDTNRLVEVYYKQGDFPKEKGRARGSVRHEMNFAVCFTVSAAAQANLTVLNNPAATATQLTSALEGLKEAAQLADDLMDEIFELVFQVLMDAQNYELGLPVGAVVDRWVQTLQKDDAQQKGELVVLSGVAHFTCASQEEITGATPLPMAGEGNGIMVDIQPAGDTADFPVEVKEA